MVYGRGWVLAEVFAGLEGGVAALNELLGWEKVCANEQVIEIEADLQHRFLLCMSIRSDSRKTPGIL